MYIISRRVSRASRSAFERFHPCQTGFPQIILLCVCVCVCVWLYRQPSLVKIRFIIADLARSIAWRSRQTSDALFFTFFNIQFTPFRLRFLLALGYEWHFSACARRLIRHFSHKILIKHAAAGSECRSEFYVRALLGWRRGFLWGLQ